MSTENQKLKKSDAENQTPDDSSRSPGLTDRSANSSDGFSPGVTDRDPNSSENTPGVSPGVTDRDPNSSENISKNYEVKKPEQESTTKKN